MRRAAFLLYPLVLGCRRNAEAGDDQALTAPEEHADNHAAAAAEHAMAGQPVFGPKSPIATREACEAVGGRFRPRLFDWMVHVMAFSGDDPWNAGHH